MLAVACGGPAVEGPPSPPPDDDAVAARAEVEPDVPSSARPTSESTRAQLDVAPEPIGTQTSARSLVVRTQPDHGAPRRGSIPPGEPFFVLAYTRADDCRGSGWAQVAVDGFVCLPSDSSSEAAPRVLPIVAEGDVVPFVYARAPEAGPGAAPVARWRSRHAFNASKPPRETLLPEGAYAFVRRRSNGPRPALLVDRKGGVVPAEPMRRLRPSGFAGRDLEAAPLPAGQTVAWTRLRDTEVLAEPRAGAASRSHPAYHAQLQVRAHQPAGAEWYEVVDTGHGVSGYIAARGLRVWTPPPPRPDVASPHAWVDVDLVHQTLTVMRGSTPVYATLVSTGKSGDATPTGEFRIYRKKAVDDMRSAEGADEPYFVEAVPWVQYFHRDFAIHAAYWHDLFGNRTSHGCVNVSPRDAALLFALTTPGPRAGWLSVESSPADPGTIVRVRKP